MSATIDSRTQIYIIENGYLTIWTKDPDTGVATPGEKILIKDLLSNPLLTAEGIENWQGLLDILQFEDSISAVKMDGIANPGVSSKAIRADHVHPTNFKIERNDDLILVEDEPIKYAHDVTPQFQSADVLCFTFQPAETVSITDVLVNFNIIDAITDLVMDIFEDLVYDTTVAAVDDTLLTGQLYRFTDLAVSESGDTTFTITPAELTGGKTYTFVFYCETGAFKDFYSEKQILEIAVSNDLQSTLLYQFRYLRAFAYMENATDIMPVAFKVYASGVISGKVEINEDGIISTVNGVDVLEIGNDGVLKTLVTDYEDLILEDDHFITKKYFDDNAVSGDVDEAIDAYIVGVTPLAADWLSLTAGGAPLTPAQSKIYVILTAGDYINTTYRWSGSVYVSLSNPLSYASQAEAEANTDNTKVMTALRTFQQFVSNIASYSVAALNTTSKYLVGAINEVYAALSGKANLSGADFTGNVSIKGSGTNKTILASAETGDGAGHTITFPAATGTAALTTDIIAFPDLSGIGDRVVEASATNVLTATKTIRAGKLTDSTTINLLTDTANWDTNGDYIGTPITGTFEGMVYKSIDYKFEAYSDNEWIRIPKG